jgi:hypothetical protein
MDHLTMKEEVQAYEGSITLPTYASGENRNQVFALTMGSSFPSV